MHLAYLLPFMNKLFPLAPCCNQEVSNNKTKRHNEEPDESDQSSKRKLRTKLP